MQRFAQDSQVMQDMMDSFAKQQRMMAELQERTNQQMKEQTYRDVAAAHGIIIPFT